MALLIALLLAASTAWGDVPLAMDPEARAIRAKDADVRVMLAQIEGDLSLANEPVRKALLGAMEGEGAARADTVTVDNTAVIWVRFYNAYNPFYWEDRTESEYSKELRAFLATMLRRGTLQVSLLPERTGFRETQLGCFNGTINRCAFDLSYQGKTTHIRPRRKIIGDRVEHGLFIIPLIGKTFGGP